MNTAMKTATKAATKTATIQLWRKDLPWLAVLGLGGAIALAAVVAERGFLEVFVLAPYRLEVAFYLAGALGLALGAVAVLWDDLLGTREFLGQRPIAKGRLATAPIGVCIAVLAGWAVAVPVLAWLFAAVTDGVFAPGHWRGVPEIEVTLAIAWPAAAIGCFATAMPAPPFVRLVAMAALTVSVGCGLDRATVHDSGESGQARFVGLCAAVALPLFVAAHHALRQTYDADRPWSAPTRVVAGGIALVATTLAAAGMIAIGQFRGLRAVQRGYPEPLRCEGQIVLALRSEDAGGWRRCDDGHRPTGQLLPRAACEQLHVRWPGHAENYEIESPRWRGYAQRSWSGRSTALLLGSDGDAWVHDVEAGTIVGTGIGAERRPFPSGSRMDRLTVLGGGGRQRTLVGAESTGELWLFDEQQGRFEPTTLPGGDRFVSFSRSDLERFVGDAETTQLLAAVFTKGVGVEYVRGARAAYVLRGDEWGACDIAEPRRHAARPEAEVTGDDMLELTVTVPARGGVPAFTHAYELRTLADRAKALLPMAAALLRPPLFQATSFCLAPADAAASVFDDPLLAGRKRAWLLLLCLAVGASSAFAVHRTLAARGAGAAARRFWAIAAACTGPVGLWLAVVCEPARAHAQRALVVPPPAPRITSSPVPEEVLP